MSPCSTVRIPMSLCAHPGAALCTALCPSVTLCRSWCPVCTPPRVSVNLASWSGRCNPICCFTCPSVALHTSVCSGVDIPIQHEHHHVWRVPAQQRACSCVTAGTCPHARARMALCVVPCAGEYSLPSTPPRFGDHNYKKTKAACGQTQQACVTHLGAETLCCQLSSQEEPHPKYTVATGAKQFQATTDFTPLCHPSPQG